MAFGVVRRWNPFTWVSRLRSEVVGHFYQTLNAKSWLNLFQTNLRIHILADVCMQKNVQPSGGYVSLHVLVSSANSAEYWILDIGY